MPNDEWCIEEYMETDYSVINRNVYNEKLQNYLAFRLLHNLLDFKVKRPNSIITKDDELITLSDLFKPYNGLSSSNLTIFKNKESENHIRYIRPSQTYEGSIAGYVDKLFIQDKHIYPNTTLYVSTDGQGSHSYSYVSSFEFVPNSNVTVLIPKREMSLQEKIYYSICITYNRYKFSYGRKPKGDRLLDILLPKYQPPFANEDIISEIFNNWKKIVK